MILRTGQKISIETLHVELVEIGLLRLGGALSTTTGQSEFRRLLDALHQQIVETRVETFGVDVRALSFVNSSAIRVFVDWISKAAQARYKLAFRTDSAVTWHRLSFSVLKSLAPNTVDIVDARAAAAGGVRVTASVSVTRSERTLRLPRRSSALDEARHFADLAVRQCSEACREAVALAVTELGENLLKYGSQNDPAHAGTIGVGVEGNRIRVRAVGGVLSPDDARSVAGIVGKLAAREPGAGALYRDRLHELFENPSLAKAQLGLIRVAFEGGFRLSCSFAPPELEIIAERQCGTGV